MELRTPKTSKSEGAFGKNGHPDIKNKQIRRSIRQKMDLQTPKTSKSEGAFGKNGPPDNKNKQIRRSIRQKLTSGHQKQANQKEHSAKMDLRTPKTSKSEGAFGNNGPPDTKNKQIRRSIRQKLTLREQQQANQKKHSTKIGLRRAKTNKSGVVVVVVVVVAMPYGNACHPKLFSRRGLISTCLITYLTLEPVKNAALSSSSNNSTKLSATS